MSTVKAATAAEKSIADTLAAARASAATSRYSVPDAAKRGKCDDGTFVALGKLAKGARAGEDALVHINGTAQSGLPYHIVLAAIRDGAVPRATIMALLGNAEAGA